MWDVLMENFNSFGTLNFEVLLLNVMMAVVLGLFVFLAYRITYSGTAFSKKFMVSLGAMIIITTTIMNVISNNVALSLGLVGALSIIRFRTAVKDVWDAMFIFWCIGIGICCGVSMYIQAVIGSVVILLLLVIFGRSRDDGKYLLVVKSEREAQNRVETTVAKYYDRSAHLRVRNTTNELGDLIYEVSRRAVNKSGQAHGVSIADTLLKIDGVISVDLVQQTDDISR